MKGQSNDDSRYVSKYTEGTFNDMFNGYYICSSIVVLVDSVFVFLPFNRYIIVGSTFRTFLVLFEPYLGKVIFQARKLAFAQIPNSFGKKEENYTLSDYQSFPITIKLCRCVPLSQH